MVHVIALALAASLASATTDPVIRIPGTRLSLGMTESQLGELGGFLPVTDPDAGGASPRAGDTRFFGLPSRATLYFRGGRLERARFEAQQVAPHAADYVEDQLRRSKFWRECLRLEPGDHVCDWIGPLRIHLEIQKDRLEARVESLLRPWEAEPDSSRDVLAAAAPVAEPATAEPATAEPPTAPIRDVLTGTASPAPQGFAPAAITAAPFTQAPAPAAAAEPAAEPVATLPETLRISLPERNPPTVWPRMSTLPSLEYPAAALRDSLQGVVWVLALVDIDGTTRSARIDRGIPGLDDAALAWATRARYAPCVRDGRPMRFWVRVAARFSLH